VQIITLKMDCPGKLFYSINWIIKNVNVQFFNVSRQADENHQPDACYQEPGE